MELRDLEYFLAIAREGSITGAAKALHLSQPALTRQRQLLEAELGKPLVHRGARRITLTEDGMLLRRRAEELLRLAERTRAEIMEPDEQLTGDISVCSGETKGLHFLTQAAKRLMARHPDVRLHVSSGDTGDVVEELEKGLIDFGLLFAPIDATRYDYLPVPYEDVWGVIMRKDAPLAQKEHITPEDLIGQPLIVPRSGNSTELISHILGLSEEQIRVAGTYSLIFNASLMCADGIGYVLGLDQILNLTGESVTCFRPLAPPITARISVVWRRDRPLSRTAQAMLDEMRNTGA